MIKVEDATVSIKGSVPELLTDITLVLRILQEKGVGKGIIEHAVELSCMSEKEIKAKSREINAILEKVFREVDQDEADGEDKEANTCPEESY